MSTTGHASRSNDESYLSYVSPLLLRRLRSPEPILSPDVERCHAAVALIDVERFSAFAERMASRGSEGLEQIATRINDTFALVVEAIERYGGVAHGFPGDSVIAIWTDRGRSHEEAAMLATRCILELLDSHKDGELPLKAGMAAGEISLVHVGGIGGHLQLLVSGAPFDGMGRAEERSSRGRLIVNEAAWRLLAPHAIASVDSDGYFEVKSIRTAPPPAAPLPTDGEEQLGTVETARAYLPAALLRQLDAGHDDWLGEFREVTTVFIQIRTADDTGSDAFERIHVAFREVQRALYRHGGDITRFAHDDKGLAVLGVFGLPPASSEDAAGRALAAAIQIDEQAPARQFRCRIGIATGRVFCGTLGAPRRREFSVVGSIPNLAARLMQSLDSGVLCDSATMRAAGAAALFESAGRLRPKNFPDAIEVFRPRRAGAGTEPAARSSTAGLIGRGKELGRLQAWIDELRGKLTEHRGEPVTQATMVEAEERGVARKGCLAVVQGEAGVGKSTLVREASWRATRSGLDVVRIGCEAVHSSSTYASWSKVLATLLRHDDAADVARRTERVLEALREAGVAEELAPLAASVLEVEIEENATTREMSGAARGDNLLALLARLFTHLAVRWRDTSGGLLLVLEDVHWLDPASWELLGVVTRTLDTGVLGVLATLRSETAPTSSHWHGIVTGADTERVSLAPLSRSETKELAQRIFQAGDVSPQLLQLTFDRTRGNPFFCEQLLSELAESGLAGVESGVATLRIRNPEQAESLVPRSIAAVVTSRLDRLSAPVQLTLKAASVIGSRFRMEVLRAIHPMQLDEEVLSSHIASALELGLVEKSEKDPGESCFKHAITCDVAYGLLLVSQRRQLHREVAEFLGRDGSTPAVQSLLFYHWRRSGDEGRALEHVDHAGAEAMRNGNYHAVAELYGYALQTLASQPVAPAAADHGKPPREALWSGHLGQAQVAIGLHEAARSNLELSLETLGESVNAGRLALAGGILRETCRQLAHRLAPRRFQGARASESRRLELAANTYEQLGFVYFSAGETLPGLYAGLRILNLAELSGQSGLMARSFGMMSLTASVIGSPRLAALYDRRAVELARETDDAIVSAYVGWVTALRSAGEARWDLVAMRIDAAVRLAEQSGDRRMLMMCLTVQAWRLYVLGDFERTTEIAERQLAMARESNNRLWEAWALNGVAEPAVMMGDHDTAVRLCQRALAVLSEESDQAEEIRALGLLAQSMLRQSRHEEAYAASRRSLDRIESSQITSFIMFEGISGACEVVLDLADQARARSGGVSSTLQRDLRRALRAMGRFTKTFALGKPRYHTVRARMAALEGSSQVAATEFDRALRAAEDLGMPYARGLALVAAARCKALDGDTRRRRAEEAASVMRSGEALRHVRDMLAEGSW